MTKVKPKVAIIILNWNRKDDTTACLKSIDRLATNGFILSTLVVDNGSTDGSIEAFSKIANISFQVIANKVNLGFAEGNNVGIRAALEGGADQVIILNNDTLVDKAMVAEMVKAGQENKSAGIISPKIYFAPGFEFHKDRYPKSISGKVIWYAGGKIDWNNIYGENFGVDDVDRGQFDEVKEIDFATGACMLVKRKVLLEVGMFDSKYFAYLEDADLSQRALMAGWKVLYTPDAYLWHKVSQSSAIGSDLNDYFITRNRLLFGLRYAAWRAKFALFRESLRMLAGGRKWQKLGVRDFYLGKFGKGSWK